MPKIHGEFVSQIFCGPMTAAVNCDEGAQNIESRSTYSE